MNLGDPKSLVAYAATLDCIHCGLCLRTCPTYQLTGAEPSSPRGRIYLMRGVAEGEIDASDPEYVEELEFCLVCRHCESVCPAGVRFGEMMEIARDRSRSSARRSLLQRLHLRFLLRVLLPSRFLLRRAFGALRFLQRSGLLRRSARMLGAHGAAALSLPEVPAASERRPLPARTSARGIQRGEVAVLEGCIQAELYGRVNRATVGVLSAIGLACRTAQDHACCGALHAHNGDLAGARALARNTIEAFDELADGRGESLPIAVNSAGCGAHMKEYGRLLEDDPAWRDRAARFAARVRDFSELVAERAPAEWKPGLPIDLERERFTWDDPCHLCHGQQIRKEPRALLDRIAGIARAELAGSESCCGSAGLYSLLRPADSAAVFAEKLLALDASGASVLVTANPGCQMQWQSGIARSGRNVRVMHLAELLDRCSR